MYKLPDSLPEDITRLGILAKEYQQKKIEATQFKAYRVPMGIYEQRKDEVYMARVRTTGGVIYPSQFLQLIELAKQHKSNLLHITTRQEIQVQNLDLAEVESLLQGISTLGLATKGGGGNTIRNIMVSQYSGIGKEVFDATPYAIQLTSKLIAETDSYLLPRKMKIAFSSDDQHIDFAAINDAGFVSKIKNEQLGFMVYAGGGAGSKPTVGEVLFDFIPVEELFYVAEALKKFFSDYGNRKNKHKARLRFIYYKLGKEETHRLIYEYYEQEKKTGELLKNDWTGFPENERPPFSYSGISVVEKDKKSFEEWKKRYVIDQTQTGYSSVLVPIILGDIYINDNQVVESYKKLLHFINQFGKDTLRFTTEQNIRLRNIPNVALPQLFYILGELNVDRDTPLLTNNIVSCTGADTCRLGIGLSKGLAKAIREEVKKSSYDLDRLSSAQIHISGCPNSCGQQLWGDIGFSGKVMRNSRTYPGYQIFLASRRDLNPKLAEPVGSMNAKSIPLFVRRLLESYIDAGEKYNSLSHYLNTEGTETAKKLIEEYKEIPSFAEEQSYYYDWGADTVFNITNRGIAECSAGLFDMIDLDLNFINTNKEELKSENNAAKRNQLLYDILFSTSRMLLVTRGADPKTTDDVFNLFIKNFIDFGLVEDKYKEIVILARDQKKYDFDSRISDIYALTDRVIDLYKTMDDSLQFKMK